jgi:hypothetical protein
LNHIAFIQWYAQRVGPGSHAPITAGLATGRPWYDLGCCRLAIGGLSWYRARAFGLQRHRLARHAKPLGGLGRSLLAGRAITSAARPATLASLAALLAGLAL